MKRYLILTLVAGCTMGCAGSSNRTAHSENKRASFGEDTFLEITADNLTRVENPQQGVTVIMNPKGTKVLAAFPNDPLAGIATASGLSVVIGKNQSTGFRSAMGTLTSTALGFFTWKSAQETTAQLVAKEQTTRTLGAQYTQRHATAVGGAKIIDPATQAVVQTPFAP